MVNVVSSPYVIGWGAWIEREEAIMQDALKDFFLKPILALAVAVPVMATVNVGDADAGHRYKRGAIIAGAIIGGAIAYNHYKRKRYKYRHHKVRRHHHHGYYHRHSRYGKKHYHRY